MCIKEFCVSNLKKSANAIILSKDEETVAMKDKILKETSFIKDCSFKFRMKLIIDNVKECPVCLCGVELHEKKSLGEFAQTSVELRLVRTRSFLIKNGYTNDVLLKKHLLKLLLKSLVYLVVR